VTVNFNLIFSKIQYLLVHEKGTAREITVIQIKLFVHLKEDLLVMV